MLGAGVVYIQVNLKRVTQMALDRAVENPSLRDLQSRSPIVFSEIQQNLY
jgi:hypothetical protein